MTVAITGASGQLGRRVTELLLERLDPSELVLVTRRPQELADAAARGVAVRHGDFDDPATLAAAFAGVDRTLLISTDAIGQRIEQHRNAVAAARDAGVRHVAYTSMQRPAEDNPAVVAPEHRATEEALRESGMAWTFLRNGIYAEFQGPTVEGALAMGTLLTNAGDGRTAYVSREDCAAVAAAVMAGEGHEQQAYDVTGPDSVSSDDLAALASERGGKPVEVVQLGDEAYVEALVSAGMPEGLAGTLASFGAAARGGFLAEVSTAVQDLTGRPPRSLRDVLDAASDELGAAA